MIPPDSFSEGRENRMRRFVQCVAALVVFILQFGDDAGLRISYYCRPGDNI